MTTREPSARKAGEKNSKNNMGLDTYHPKKLHAPTFRHLDDAQAILSPQLLRKPGSN